MGNRNTTLTDRCGEGVVSTTYTSSLPPAEHMAAACRAHADALDNAGCSTLADEYRAVADELDPQ